MPTVIEVTSDVESMVKTINTLANNSNSGYITFTISGKWLLSLTNPRIILGDIEILYYDNAFLVNNVDILAPLKEKGFSVKLMSGPYRINNYNNTLGIDYYYTR